MLFPTIPRSEIIETRDESLDWITDHVDPVHVREAKSAAAAATEVVTDKVHVAVKRISFRQNTLKSENRRNKLC